MIAGLALTQPVRSAPASENGQVSGGPSVVKQAISPDKLEITRGREEARQVESLAGIQDTVQLRDYDYRLRVGDGPAPLEGSRLQAEVTNRNFAGDVRGRHQWPPEEMLRYQDAREEFVGKWLDLLA